jgi:hypothetical protein
VGVYLDQIEIGAKAADCGVGDDGTVFLHEMPDVG